MESVSRTGGTDLLQEDTDGDSDDRFSIRSGLYDVEDVPAEAEDTLDSFVEGNRETGLGESASGAVHGEVLVEAQAGSPAVPGSVPKKSSRRSSYATECKRLLVSYPWKETQEVTTWSHHVQSMLKLLQEPAPPDLAQEDEKADLEVTGVRLITPSEIMEGMIKKRLEEEGFDDLSELEHDEEEEDDTQGKLRKRSKPLRALRDQATKKLRLDREDIEQVAPLVSYEDVTARRWGRCVSASAKLLQDSVRPTDWGHANRTSRGVFIFDNAVRGSPHKRFLHRITSRFTNQHDFNTEPYRECTAPDLSAVPADMIRVKPHEVIISVAVCNKFGAKEQEYDVLASQTLHELRDAFYFAGDWMYDGPSRLGSACMFIDGAFYSDLRYSSSCDYSKDLVEWINVTGHPPLQDQPRKSMALRLCDLGRIPFGEKCCYIRQGDIEHHMYFTNARLFDEGSECPLKEGYPCLTFMRNFHKQRCVACRQHPAIWVVLDSSRCPYNPGFWCADCFRHFFQDKHGEFIQPVDYRMFPYLHDEG